MAKRQRIDSTAGALAVAAAFKKILPPANVSLEDDELSFFGSVIDEFARSEWSAHQLELAAMLARTMCGLEREQRDLRLEGSVAKSDKGTPVVNPRQAIVQMHISSILSMRRSLALHARATGGDTRDVSKRRDATKDLEAGFDGGDDLIARPN